MFTDPRMQILAFVVVAVVTTFAGRPYVRKWLAKQGGTDVNARPLEGLHAEVVEDFEGGHGRVFIDGVEWAARLEGDGPVVKGDSVTVVGRVEGATLVVRLTGG